MKANELMVGDWVAQRYSGLMLKVSEVRPPYIFADGEGGQFHEDTLVPIPLTPEILEKNGWVRTKYCYGRDCMEIHGADELPEGVDNDLSMARWSIDKNFQYHFLDLFMWKGSVMQHDVHYVHQLHHAFRIFGIEKEIEL